MDYETSNNAKQLAKVEAVAGNTATGQVGTYEVNYFMGDGVFRVSGGQATFLFEVFIQFPLVVYKAY